MRLELNLQSKPKAVCLHSYNPGFLTNMVCYSAILVPGTKVWGGRHLRKNILYLLSLIYVLALERALIYLQERSFVLVLKDTVSQSHS